MVIEIKYQHRDGYPNKVDLSYEGEPFTVGRSPECTVALDQPNLSRFALVIEEPEETRVRIKSNQRYGYVQVTREDGERKATLGLGEEFACGAGTYRVQLRTAAEEVLAVEVTVPARLRVMQPGALTVGMWSRSQLFNPTPEDDWRWLAALATVVAQTSARRKGEALDQLATAWQGGSWPANVQNRLDKVLRRLGLHASRINKLDSIAAEVRSSGVIQAVDYSDFRNEVQRRALIHLSRGEIGLLGWGYLAGGAN